MSMFELTQIFNTAKHYDEIVNYNFNVNDKQTKLIIDKYREYILGQTFPCDFKELEKIDNAIYAYVSNLSFNQMVKEKSEIEPYKIAFLYNEFKLADTKEIKLTEWV